jgi:hypothetical protein
MDYSENRTSAFQKIKQKEKKRKVSAFLTRFSDSAEKLTNMSY